MKHQDQRSLFTTVAHDPVDTRHQGSINVPVYQTSLFAFESYEEFDRAMAIPVNHRVYSRGNNPTVHYLEQKLAELEAGEAAKCFASGMAAITSAIEQWEPRFRVTRIEVVKVTRDGQLHVFLEGEYRPRAILGDFTVEGARRLDAYANPDGLLIEERLNP